MCTLSLDDTQILINPNAATAPRDKWKPPPSELPSPPPPTPPSPPPPAADPLSLSTSSHCEGYQSSCTLRGISALYFSISVVDGLVQLQPEMSSPGGVVTSG
ncbi:unnamed protein product [Pleuronectes platessa]|uniref:Uncharacterized protein n=1 Tax=Pleuronectes platessa TaxID=8262 RepID=A0A9N7U5J6_PLEPL|nr:unnamed protein product [Pleuronectes platessa]